jgi:hypothetical protein
MHSFEKAHLSDDHCFLCGAALTDDTRSDEHVFPRWLQHKHNLWNQRVTLLNGSTLPYRLLKISSCRGCNNNALSQLETDVQAILSGPFRSVSRVEEHRLFQWCSKVLYGLLHRELRLLTDRRDPSRGPIVRPELLEGLLTFHHFTTSICRPFRFHGFTPYSLFVTEALRSRESGSNFDYRDCLALGAGEQARIALTLALRTDHFAIFCVFQDNGLQKEHFQGFFDRFAGIPLHPIQFLELACKTVYKHSKLSFDPRYLSQTTGPDAAVIVVPITFPAGAVWSPWVNREFAEFFCACAAGLGIKGIPDPEDFCVEDRTTTWLFDGSGRPQRMPED